ncbi:GTPase domain-containing protein [Photobacterium sp. ZSDE20]|uniref:GTPase domain-containing protein n=1 Tax=Photobacterium pectinilyticum TaxID=2906793 RepID=A0ABT1N688_9GAMM|nr:GTPase domain-containing protein [Photobacterium sp. ZSDE20]MCQ1058749.1 GTPase domain-containing protein [Photobacterium sp. ZSDE20]MDD1823531.1 GTPase domain-containing protein [Photobacterium sp. ZSDE20]
MKKTINSVSLLSRISAGVAPLVFASLIIPLFVLAGWGLFRIIQDDQWLFLSILIASSSCVVIAGAIWLRQTRRASNNNIGIEGEYDVAPSGEWGEFDREVWTELNPAIARRLEQDDSWIGLREHALSLSMEVASQYYPERDTQALSFTAPEFLLMLEKVSHRYRLFLLNHIPFAETLKLSYFQQGYQHKEKLGAAKKFYDVYRVFRAMTSAGLVAEARGQLLGRLFDEVSEEVQHTLKKVLLQEVLSVAIDLYSGRYKAAEGELNNCDTASEHFAEELKPLRVAIVGQVSAGKSSLVNTFVGNMVAEVSAIPSTESIVVHRCYVDGIDIIHLVDLPGIDGQVTTNKLLVKQMVQSDIVLWVLKANQPARKSDVILRQQFDEYYQQADNRSRKKPQVIMVLNQVDRLSPALEWQPPYDLSAPQSAKANTIKAALDFNKAKIMPDDEVVVAMPPNDQPYNMDSLAEALLSAFQDGVNTQLNRRRIEHKSDALTKQVKRLYRLGKVAVKRYTVKS